MKHYFPFFCLVILLFPACVRSPQLEGYGQARGFTLEKNSEGEVTAARILSDGQIFEYEFCRREEGRSGFVDGSFRRFRVAVPQIRTAVCTSTMLVLLDEIGAVEAVAGMDGDYTTVPSFRKRIEEGKISFLADGMVLDKEKLAALKPETVFFSPASGDRSEIQKIIDCGAVPVPIQDWREPDPLGRARWAELEAAFFGKSEEAALLFRETEQRYRKIAEEVSLRSSRPQVIFHLPVNGQWRMPSGNSFTAAAVRDGGGLCLMPEAPSETVLLDLETVFSRFSGATVWLIHAGTYADRKSFERAALSAFGDSRLASFPPLGQARIAVNDRLVDDRGFNGFYDYSPLFPDRLLEDLATVTAGGEPVHFYRVLK